MSKKAPSTAQLLVIVGFALSCFGILLFLWVTFGGPTPFRAKPYEIKVPFREATQLAQQSDVRISGVTVGKVKTIDVSDDGKMALATVHLDTKYGPVPKGTRAILRTKTLLGETYVELTPGNRDEQPVPDGGTLAPANVAESVQLDEIFRTFDADTRADFQEWMQESAVAIQGQGASLSNAFAEFDPFFSEFAKLFRLLDTQQNAVRQVFSNGATSLQALRGREGQLAQLVAASNEVFTTAAARDRDLEDLFRAFPTFEDESKLTLERLRKFSADTRPLIRQLVPAAEELSPTFIAFSELAPQAKALFEGLETVIDRSPRAFPAVRKLFRDEFPVLLRAVNPFLRNLNPILQGLDMYKNEITAAMANVAAATNAVRLSSTGRQIHYLRVLGNFTPESLATFPTQRPTTNRTSAYSPPKWGERLPSGLLSFDTRHCSDGATATLNPNTPNEAAFNERVGGDPKKSNEFFEMLQKLAFSEQPSTDTVPAPGCSPQAPFSPIYGNGAPTMYQHTFEQPR